MCGVVMVPKQEKEGTRGRSGHKRRRVKQTALFFFFLERERGPRTFLLTRLFFLNVLPARKVVVVSIAILAVLNTVDTLD